MALSFYLGFQNFPGESLVWLEHTAVFYDESGAIGRRYRRMDEAGTPYCITIDFDTIEKDNCVTVRDRDSLKQERIEIDSVKAWLEEKVDGI